MLRLRGGSALSRFAWKNWRAHSELLPRKFPTFAQNIGTFARLNAICGKTKSPFSIGFSSTRRRKASLKGVAGQHAECPAGELLLVLPRPGTISPWSTKATDIARHCGLEAVDRLERGVAFYIQTKDEPSAKFSPTCRIALLALIHDRMTEAVFGSFDDAEKLFRHFEPAPLNTVDVLAGGTMRCKTPIMKWDWRCRLMKLIISQAISCGLGAIPPMWN